MRKHCQVIPGSKKTCWSPVGEGVGRRGMEGVGTANLQASDCLVFYLLRLPVDGGTIIIDPESFVLRLLADLVLFSVVLGEASFLWNIVNYELKCMYT